MDNLGGALIILGILALVLYFLPTILSLILRRRNTLAIFAMNLLLGWTLVGWVVALVWALTKDNQNQTVIIKNEIKTDSKVVTINKSLDDSHTEKIDDTNNTKTSTADKSTIGTVDDSHKEKIDDTNNTKTSTADKSTIGTVENNSNRKKILNILLFSSFLLGAFLVGFFVDHYFNRNQSKNTAIVSNQSNSSNSIVISNQSNSSNSTNNSSINGSVANENEIDKCSNYFDSQNYQLALQSGQKAVKIYPRSAKAHGCLGMTYEKLGDFKLSIKELKTAEKLTNSKDVLGAIYSFIGNDYYNLGDLNNALLYHDRELKIARDLNNQEQESAALNNISLIYYKQGNYDKALEYLNKSLQFTSKPNDITTIYNNIAVIYRVKGDNNKAVEYLKKAIEFAQKAGDYHGTAIGMLNLGGIYIVLKNFSSAQYYLQKGLLMMQKLGDKYWEANGYKFFGRLYLAQNQEGLAREYFTKAYNLYKATGDNSDAQAVYEKYLKQ
jgi:tetratricopeptide (TPR) repeat protein